ncbi:cytochrome P450 [Aspergillus undulatus]|uniref:cytochrome P450 n=1 Tax=Aspergillus undulatus TaxID=1810928 RepID=UPI003CCE10E4
MVSNSFLRFLEPVSSAHLSIWSYGILFFFLYCIGWVLYTRLLHPLKNIPGPFWASVSGYWYGYQVSTGKMEHIQRRLHEKHGPLVRIGPNEVSVADPSSIRVIYGSKSGFTKTSFYPPWAVEITPHGDQFSQLDEAKHTARRKLVNNVYSMSSVLESEEYIDECMDMFMQKMAKFAQRKEIIDLGVWTQWYALDVIGSLFFGQQFGFMRDEHDFDNYILSMDTLMPPMTVMCLLPEFLMNFQPILGLFLPRVRNAAHGFDEIRNAGKFWVEQRLQQMADPDQMVNRSDLLSKLFRVRDAKEDFDILGVQSESVAAIFAGSDTTSITFRAVFYYLMKHPDAYEKLLEEIDQADRGGRLSRCVQYNEALQLPYLVACIKEAIRMHPSVALGLPRYVPAGGRVIAGQFLPAGTTVGINPAVIHYEKEIFGDDVTVFNPTRWLRDPEATAEMDRHMLHFGAGSRTCIGKNISLAEIHKLVPQVLRTYHLELADPDKEWETQNYWFNKQTGIKVYVTARSRS